MEMTFPSLMQYGFPVLAVRGFVGTGTAPDGTSCQIYQCAAPCNAEARADEVQKAIHDTGARGLRPQFDCPECGIWLVRGQRAANEV